MSRYVIVKINLGGFDDWYTAYKKFLGLFYIPGFGKIEHTTSRDIGTCEKRLMSNLKKGIVVKEINA